MKATEKGGGAAAAAAAGRGCWSSTGSPNCDPWELLAIILTDMEGYGHNDTVWGGRGRAGEGELASCLLSGFKAVSRGGSSRGCNCA